MSSVASHQKLLAECRHALKEFLASNSRFYVHRTIRHGDRDDNSYEQHHRVKGRDVSKSSGSSSDRSSRAAAATAAVTEDSSCRTIFILDSSFNPPSRAHAGLALSALRTPQSARYPGPRRLLMLFSTHNADKNPSPAAFEHRLAMMVLLAQDVADSLMDNMKTKNSMGDLSNDDNNTTAKSEAESPQEGRGDIGADEIPQIRRKDTDVEIDVGLTTEPYYSAKTDAIEDFGVYAGQPRHVHLVGFDTLVRIFEPRYYKDFTPPLSALAPFFSRHALRATIRPTDSEEDEKQLHWSDNVLGSGSLKKDGGQREWKEKVEMVSGEEGGRDVSSTKIREAISKQDWDVVDALCTKRVAAWVRASSLYTS